MMTNDTSILTAWYDFAASAPGFLGYALHLHRLSLAQQRALLGLHDASTDALWIRLQAMPLPRSQHFDADLHRILASVLRSSPHVTIHTTQLAALLRATWDA